MRSELPNIFFPYTVRKELTSLLEYYLHFFLKRLIFQMLNIKLILNDMPISELF